MKFLPFSTVLVVFWPVFWPPQKKGANPVFKYSQHRQNYQNSYFRAEVGQKCPKEFPEPPSVGKHNVGYSAVSYTAKTFKAEIT